MSTRFTIQVILNGGVSQLRSSCIYTGMLKIEKATFE